METTTKYHHVYINNCVGIFAKTMADWFRNEWFNRCDEVVISTFSRAVQHWLNKKKNSGENFSWVHPLLSFDFGMDFEPDPQSGRFFHQYPMFGNKFATKLYNPVIYQDDTVLISPAWNRYKGRVEMNVFCSSVYEYMDTRFLAFQWWGGLERIITPVNVNGYIIIPDDILSTIVKNEWTGERHSLDWSNNDADIFLVRNINQNKMCFPFTITPYLKLLSIGDATEKYGGSGEEISEHILSIEFEWECYLPTHLNVVTTTYPDFCSSDSVLDIIATMTYAPLRTPDTANEDVIHVRIPDEYFSITADSTHETFIEHVYEYDKSYVYVITEDDEQTLNNGEDSEKYIDITLIDPAPNCNMIRLSNKYGSLKQDYAWGRIDEYTIRIYGFVVSNLSAGDIINIAYYRDKDYTPI